MWDFILHILGICPDHFTHFNLVDLLILGPAAFLSLKAKHIYYSIKRKIRR